MTFLSRHHPGNAPRAVVLLRAQGGALAWALFGVMTVTLAAVLQGEPVLWPFAAALVAAYVGSAALVHGRLRRTPALAEVEGPGARVWSVWDVAGPRRPAARPVWEARLVVGELVVSLGDAVETFQRGDWADFDALVDAMRAAAHQGAPEGVPA
ncbi:MAG TPA: hypothetical protein VF576_12500 [Rubricoccaceae bacterium]